MIITEKLLALAAAYEQKAASLRLAAAELNGHQVAKKQRARGGIEATIAEAALLRAQANGTHGTTSDKRRASWTPARRAAQAARLRRVQATMQAGRRAKKKSSRGAGAAAKKQRRQQTEKRLAKIAASSQPVPASRIGGGLSILLQHGYLAKQGEGYVRTDKPFTV